MRLLGTLFFGLALAYAALAAILFVFQSRFIYFPEMGRQDKATPAQLRLPFEEVRIATADGETLHGWFVPATNARATVLFFHGNAGSIVHRLDWLPMFQQLRLSVLMVDYRGFGAS
ncbi:MAG: alpha/beta hydrolase, partial [Gallionellaceae bacterium]|nr:alpha/beta hydrolase [Gallionellaceae bacterium]